MPRIMPTIINAIALGFGLFLSHASLALTGANLENCKRLATVKEWKGTYTLTGSEINSATSNTTGGVINDQWNFSTSYTAQFTLPNPIMLELLCNFFDDSMTSFPGLMSITSSSAKGSARWQESWPGNDGQGTICHTDQTWVTTTSTPEYPSGTDIGVSLELGNSTLVFDMDVGQLPATLTANYDAKCYPSSVISAPLMLNYSNPDGDSMARPIKATLPTATSASMAIRGSRTFNADPYWGWGGMSLRKNAGTWTETWDLKPYFQDGSTEPDPKVEDPCLSSGSIIGCENQSLGEAVAIAGTPYKLYYQSNRMAGAAGVNTVATAWAKATGGWTPNVWHRYDPASKTLFLGSGAFRNGDSLGTLKRTATSGYLIPSEDGGVVYEFSSTGVHLKTRHALTGTTLLTFARDASGRLTKITDASNNITQFTRNGSGLLTSIVSPYGLTSTVTLNANGFLTVLTNPNGQTVKAAYTAKGLMTSFTNPQGKVSSFTYNADGLLTQDKDASGGIQKLARSGNVVTHTSAKGLVTTYETVFQADGVDRVMTEPSGLSRTLSQSALGDTVTTADGTEITSTAAADPRFGEGAGYPETYKTTTPGGLIRNLATTRAATLADAANLFSLTEQVETLSVNGKIFTNGFDAASLTFTETSPFGRTATTLIDTLGRPVSTTLAGLNPVTYGYDTRGRLDEISVGATTPRSTLLAYNANGYLNQITNALGQPHALTRDKLGRITQQSREDGSLVKFAYDAGGNPVQVTNPTGGITLFTYSNTGLPVSVSLPEASGVTPKHTYAYNLDRQLTKHTYADGSAITFGYDAAGRLNKATAGSNIWTYGYNATHGYLNSLDAPGGIGVDLVRDGPLLTKLSWSGPVTGQVGLAYNNNFKLKSVSVNGLNAIAYIYDTDGLMTKAGALVITRKTDNGLRIGSTLGGVKDTLTYNAFGEVTKYQATYNGSPLLTLSYVFDKLGRITKVTESVLGGANKVSTYQYDALGQLVSATVGAITRTYGYDDNGNRTSFTSSAGTSQTGVYDAQDKLLSDGATNYAYSGNGALINQTQGANTTQYEYNARGDLTAAVLSAGERIDYLVDGMGLRVGKKTNGALEQAFLYQRALKPAAELNGTGQIVSRFVYGGRVNVPEYMVRGGVTYRILTDHLGSPRLVVNTTTGAVAQRLAYDEFGNLTQDTQPGFQPFGFAGGLYDPDTKLLHYGDREFDPKVGRFTSMDPVLFSGGATNHYVNLNDPTNTVDPNGREWTWESNPVRDYIASKFKSVKIGPVEFATDHPEASVGVSQSIEADGTEIISVEAEAAISIAAEDRSSPDQFSWRAKVGAKIPALTKLPLIGKYFCTEAEASGKVHVFDDASKEVFRGGEGTNLGRATSLLRDSND